MSPLRVPTASSTGSGFFISNKAMLYKSDPRRARSVAEDVLGGHQPDVGLLSLCGTAETWQGAIGLSRPCASGFSILHRLRRHRFCAPRPSPPAMGHQGRQATELAERGHLCCVCCQGRQCTPPCCVPITMAPGALLQQIRQGGASSLSSSPTVTTALPTPFPNEKSACLSCSKKSPMASVQTGAQVHAGYRSLLEPVGCRANPRSMLSEGSSRVSWPSPNQAKQEQPHEKLRCIAFGVQHAQPPPSKKGVWW